SLGRVPAESALDAGSLSLLGEHRLTCPRRCAPASGCFAALVRLRPEDPVAHARLARALSKEGKGEEARPQVDLALARAGDRPEPLVACAQALGALGEGTRVGDLLRRALDAGYPPEALVDRDFGAVDGSRVLEIVGRR